MKLPALVGATEIAALLGVTRQRVQQLARTPGFPEPAAVVSNMNIWILEDINAWAARSGRPLKS